MAAPAATVVLRPAGRARELRLDLFRGLALWLIYIDHVSPDVLSWFTIRSYGFSDAAEIFIFISGYTAAFVYGRAMFESGFVIATARILRRVWQIYAAHVLTFAILVAEVSYVAVSLEKPFYAEEMEIVYFLKEPGVAMSQALLLMYRPLNMDVLPLYIVLMLFLPLILQLINWRANLTLAFSVVLYMASWKYDLHLVAYPKGFWSFNPFAWQLLFVFGAWCALGGTKQMSRLLASPSHTVDFGYLSGRGVRRHHDLVLPATRPCDAAMARAMDLSDRQDRPRRAPIRALSRAGGDCRAVRTRRMAGLELALAVAHDPVRAAFAGDFLPRRGLGVHGVFRADGAVGGAWPAYPGRHLRNPVDVRRRVAVVMVQALCRRDWLTKQKRRQSRVGRRRPVKSDRGRVPGLRRVAAIDAVQ